MCSFEDIIDVIDVNQEVEAKGEDLLQELLEHVTITSHDDYDYQQLPDDNYGYLWVARGSIRYICGVVGWTNVLE